MINPSVAALLSEMGDLLELSKDNPFRIRAFRRASQSIESFPQDVAAFSREQLLEIPGIGQGIADLIVEFKTKGSAADHQKLKSKFPGGVLQMMHVGGVGPRRAAQLFRERKIDSLKKLEQAAKKGELKTMAGFGEKLESTILKNVQLAEEGQQRWIVTVARAVAERLLSEVKKSPGVTQAEIAGSARRWRETVGDIDIIVSSKSPQKTIDHFLKISNPTRVLAAGGTKASVVLPNGIQCDLRVVDEKSYGAALVYFTGSKEHNVRLRELAQKKGFSLNEYGLFKGKNTQTGTWTAGRTEADVYRALGLDWIAPELREDRGEIEAAAKKKLPRLIEMKDVRGDFHNHTTLSDGADSLEAMVAAAQKWGWKWFFTADHSPSLKIAHGLPVPILKKKMEDVRKLNAASKSFRIFTSSEVDILGEGQLDYPDDMLAALDCVVASVHSRFQQSPEEMTERLCKAIENPHTDILGHISGRLIHKREGYSFDMERVLATAQRTQTAIEINGQPDRQELGDVHVKQAVEMGIPLALNTDAHSTAELDHIVLALHIARRGWAEPSDIINTHSAKDIKQWLSQR
jgi:DNA polymerase (family 10)